MIEPRVKFADQLFDERTFSRRRPALDQHDHRELCLHQKLLLREELVLKLLDLCIKRRFVLTFFCFKIL